MIVFLAIIFVAFVAWKTLRQSSNLCPHESPKLPRSHAVVVGAGFAGLMAARVLSDHFKKVTVIERDGPGDTAAKPDSLSQARRGVPQGRFPHLIIARGLEIIDYFFPGVRQELIVDGAAVINFLRDNRASMFGFKIPRPTSTPDSMNYVFATRPFFERHVLARVNNIPNVTIVQGTVSELLYRPEDNNVYGVTYRNKSGVDDQQLLADFVVDCSGRKSMLDKSLKDIGKEPEMYHVDPCAGYASAGFRPTAEQLRDIDCKCMVNMDDNAPQGQPHWSFFEVDNGLWLLTLAGYGPDNQPPTDIDKIHACLGGSFTEEIKTVINTWKRETEWIAYRGSQTMWRRFDLMKPGEWPENLVALGDAVCVFNPFYGQGITSAALQCLTLDSMMRAHVLNGLQQDWCGLSTKVQKGIVPVLKKFWNNGQSEDMARPSTKIISGPGRTLGLKIQHAISRELIGHILGSNDVNKTIMFYEVAQMLAPETRLLTPSIVVPVLFRTVRKALLNLISPAAKPKAS
eukprot:TRINITY_DN10330_c0_g3_i1.p1 TRINITY_DN10330_c0_g3~~TRINITY_DN10330_c0_g3_i1.p1  ORF type:complete len:515 (+),score=132.50 TRINITY_DN10330_c0_g3_i1:137-1681(+)